LPDSQPKIEMSAIAGVLETDIQEVPLRETIRIITEKLGHRGRQDEGYVFFQGEKAIRFYGKDTHHRVREQNERPLVEQAPAETWLALSHRLGSLFSDVHPAEHQPFSDAAGRTWLVLDGEIFNAPQLAKELHEKGIPTETGGQAEVVLKGYQLWGDGILSRLEGSFAFVIYDLANAKILAARDPFGIRPFYYCMEEGVFAFASELKALFGLPFVSKKVSKSAVFDYLLLGESETQIQSIFRGLSELMPGTAMSIFLPKGNSKIWSYYNIATDSKIERYSRNKVSTLAHRLRKALVQSVSDHLSPGYSTAYRLNDDIESLVFPFLLKESIREIQPAERPDPAGIYQCILQENTFSENNKEVLKEACQDLGVQLATSICTYRDFTENLLRVCFQQDIPFTSLSVFHQFRMMETASAAGIKLLIEPVGGTQLFSSSRHHLVQFLNDLFAKGNYTQFMDNLSGYRGAYSEKAKILFQLSKKSFFKSTADDIKEAMLRSNQEEFSYLKDNFKDRYFKNLENKVKALPDSLNQLIASEIHGSLVKEQLRTSDRNARAFGMEIRYPYVSSRSLSEPILKASSIYKIREGQPANLLNKAMRGLLPDYLSELSKPASVKNREAAWLRDASNELKEFITPDLDDFIDSRSLRNDWDKLFNSRNQARLDFLWRVVNLGIWRKVYFS
jgi:asparagine synthase (glutamine-hydrolysing)